MKYLLTSVKRMWFRNTRSSHVMFVESTKRGLQMHKKKSHAQRKEDKMVTFKEAHEEVINFVEESNNYKEQD